MLEPTPLYGGNAAFLDALYEQYLLDPASVGERWRKYFAQLAPAGAECAHGPIDRKSTRLNSSHLVISYAVFCLKKKKNHHTVAQDLTVEVSDCTHGVYWTYQ